MVNEFIDSELCTISEKQAKEIRSNYEQRSLSYEALKGILCDETENEKFFLEIKRLRSYFPKSYSLKECKEAVWRILENWFKRKAMLMIITDKILNPQTYLELMTGKYYPLNVDNQLEAAEKILDREFGEGTFWSYSLTDIANEEHKIKLVPVEIVNITEDCKQYKFCRLFQVLDDWNEKTLIERLANI